MRRGYSRSVGYVPPKYPPPRNATNHVNENRIPYTSPPCAARVPARCVEDNRALIEKTIYLPGIPGMTESAFVVRKEPWEKTVLCM